MRIPTAFVLCMAAMSTHADESIVFVSAFKSGEEGGIHAFRFSSDTGRLQLLHRTSGINNPFFIAISPDEKFLYAIDSADFTDEIHEFVAAYAIHGRTGKLKRLNRVSARGTASCYLDVDATGKTVVVANYFTGSVAAFPVLDDGSLATAASLIQHSGSSVDRDRQQGPYAHSIVVSPDNRFALAADLGIDRVLIYRLASDSAVLTPGEPQSSVLLPPGSGPRHLVFHPNGKWVYVINELGNTVSLFDYCSSSGTLTSRQIISTVPADFSGTSHTADLKISPNGKFLYGSNRGHDSIAVYHIASDGRLNLESLEPTRGQGPQNLLVTPDNRWLLCANMPGNNVTVFAIDSDTGMLTATGNPISVPMPACIGLLK
ncbi:MAG: lactonase family protein [Fuerstiella sp.]|nr:lactonase family protein [Fuerstiella sp.]